MTWSTDSKNFKAEHCEPYSGSPGTTVEVVVTGTAQLGVFPAMEDLEATLFGVEPGAALVVPTGEDPLPAARIVSVVKSFETSDNAWQLVAEFRLEADTAGAYQLVIGWQDRPADTDDPELRGEFTQYGVVDTDDEDGLFRIG